MEFIRTEWPLSAMVLLKIHIIIFCLDATLIFLLFVTFSASFLLFSLLFFFTSLPYNHNLAL